MTATQISTRYASIPAIATIRGLVADLKRSRTVQQADACVGMKACQIAMTGSCGGTRATPEQREWAVKTWADGAPNVAGWAYAS